MQYTSYLICLGSGGDGLMRWWQTLDYSLSDRSPLTVSIEAFLRVVITKHDKQCKLLTCQLSCLPDSCAKFTAMCITLWKGSSYKWLFFVIHSPTSLILTLLIYIISFANTRNTLQINYILYYYNNQIIQNHG